ncbi:sialidase B (Neuraminidase B) [Streptococcus pneumoniae]|uniref:neuraminidase NanB n=1 Tax=Streptococcus pneumoniae TaxID=1313 RepID=UPI0005E03BB1|nr:neuraminidase NanB [Streptococcus pneumoniae]CEX90031.1 sialidase B (Neuraminidase B) [Streptococcus pneumoniae]CJA24773.1 sialidase B (Neuraminidase B) [Streptococcus pneumoniae]CJE90926.1 sialidase B (Neuraminidase B) [Streptococcus pneumoniae]COD35428.1 sialidase B (Neuraminidase B) [Streptococcus pneumoniae]COL39551.1 sialidase B (Neuraminidase B) [Streptococcus pneumoniae]
MNKRGLYSKLGISAVGISLLMGVPTLIHANELNYGQLSISPIFQGGSYQLNNKSIDISSLLLDKLSGESQTVVMKFKADKPNSLQALFGLSNSKAGFKNNYFSIFMRDSGEIGVEIRDAQKGINYLFSRPASLWGKHKGQAVENTLVFVSDSKDKTYTMYVNGIEVFSETVDTFLPISNINGIDKATLGAVNREGKEHYLAKGSIDEISLFNKAISDQEVSNIPLSNPFQLIFQSGDSTQANYFRIPTLYTLSSGRVLSSIDARYGGTHDSKSKINIATSYSDDNGKTWSEPIFAMKFNDYEEQLVYWPRDNKLKNSQISGSASFIDSSIVEDKKSGKTILLADVMPAGIGNNNANKADSGFKEINGHYYLKLKKNGDNDFRYTVRENGVVYDETTNKPTNYTINDKYEVLEGGKSLTVEQYSVDFDSGSLREKHNGKQVPMNVFYKDSLFKVTPTNYIAMTTSQNRGESWEQFKLLPPFLGEKHNGTYLCPVQGLALKSSNRLIFATYTSGELTYLISDDSGQTWKKSSASIPFKNATAEAQMVELRDGVIRTFFRTTTGKIAYMTSRDSGETWSEVSYIDGIQQTSYGTQVSAIKYSQLIDGKEAVILSTPNSRSGRKGGQLVVGLVNKEDDSIDWKYHYDIDLPSYGYAYSAITELPNHHIGVLFEKYDSWSRNELHLSNVVQYIDLEINDLTK